MTFVPQRGTPLAQRTPAGRLGELVTIATMRLTMPDRLIPASLDVDGIAGLESRIAAGANVVTSLVPPDTGLAGVSQSELDIDEGLRTAPVVTRAARGRRPARGHGGRVRRLGHERPRARRRCSRLFGCRPGVLRAGCRRSDARLKEPPEVTRMRTSGAAWGGGA